MNEKLFIQLCEAGLAITSLVGIVLILAASWYDLRIIRTKKQLQAVRSKMTNRRQPPVTVLIYTHNQVKELETCLDSVSLSKYKHMKILVADNASTDGTKKYLVQYKRLHPNLPLATYHAKTIVSHSMLFYRSLKKETSGQLVVILNAAATITPTLILECATRFTASETLDVLRLRLVPHTDVSISALSLYFYTLSKNIVYKSLAKHSSWLGNYKESGLTIRRTFLTGGTLPKNVHTDYASTTTYTQSPKSTSKFSKQSPSATHQLLHISEIFSLPLLLAAMTYFIFTAATLQNSLLLTLSYTIICIWLIACIWLDDVYNIDKRIELLFGIPFMYFVFYAKGFYRLIMMIWKLTQYLKTPNISLKIIREMIQIELYSTHF
jgi:hypothetical protein